MNVTTRQSPTALLTAALLAAAAFAATTTGLVQLPDLEALLTDLSDTLGSWTYGLVTGLAFLETGAFVIGYAFHESFSAAADALTHGALALAVLAAGVLAWRHHRRAA